MSADPAGPAEVEAARLLLARMGVSPADLLAATPTAPARPMPTVGAWIDTVTGMVSQGTARSYGSYWKKARAAWGERALDQVSASDIRAEAERAKATAVVRRNSRGGRNAAENFIAAMRCLYKHAQEDDLIDERNNPARRVTKPRRLPSTRRALPDERLDEVNTVVATTGNDPELDSLIVRLHEETAGRRGGAIAMRPRDLDDEQCLVYLREKGETARWQPVSPTLMRALLHHVETRGTSDRNGQLLRYGNGNPITDRRYDNIWKRVGQNLPWAYAQQISAHWLRHTTLTWVERAFGFAVARAYAGHSDSRDNITAGYVKADIHDVATALAALTGEPHPLARRPGTRPPTSAPASMAPTE